MLFRNSSVFLLIFVAASAMGQLAPDNVPQGIDAIPAAGADKPPAASPKKDGRNISGYPFPALADTVAAAQNMTQAMMLRDYCTDKKLSDEFVRERLVLFGRITGREEDCQSLLDYMRR